MTLSEISSYELAYQIRTYLSSHEMTQEAFADLTDFPAPLLSRFLRDGGPELSVSQMVRICNVLSISMDSLVHGPVQDKRFEQLIRKCIFANKLKGSPLYSPYIRYLERWQERKIKLDCLDRYTQWFMYLSSLSIPQGEASLGARPRRLASSVCFTRKISRKQKEKLEKMIEDSKKK